MSKSETRARIAIVAGEFNRVIVDQLVLGARDALARNGLAHEEQSTFWVPGAFELPLAADRLAASGMFDAILTLGAVIRGDTPHFDYVAGECARGVAQVSVRRGLPVIFGVLTTDNIEQALDRAGTGEGNKGFDSAMAALRMLAVLRDIDSLTP